MNNNDCADKSDSRDMSKSARVYVGGLQESVKKEDLEREFSKYGKLSNVWVAWNPPGFAFVEFDDLNDAEEAVRSLNGQDIFGSRLRVEISRGRDGRGRGRGRSFGGGGDFRGGYRGGFRGGRGGFRGGSRDGGSPYRGGRGFGSRGGRGGSFGGPRRYGGGDYDSSSSSSQYKEGGSMSRGGGDYGDSGDYYNRSSSYRSRSPVGGARYMSD